MWIKTQECLPPDRAMCLICGRGITMEVVRYDASSGLFVNMEDDWDWAEFQPMYWMTIPGLPDEED